MKIFSLIPFLILGVSVSVFSVMPAFGQEVDELKSVIDAQQKQLEMQQKQLDEQRKLLQKLQLQVETIAEDPKLQVETIAKGPKMATQAPAEKVVTSGLKQIKLAISGHVARAIQIRDDGKNSETYFVDNDNSESQVRFVGTAKATEDLTLGTTIEVSMAPNLAGQIDQNNQETNNVFDERKVEITLDSKRYGKLSLGKGYTPSYTTGAVDLSKTLTVTYSTIVDTAGSHLFRNSDDGTLTDIRIFHGFDAHDGLNRRNRLRYDTPKFGGFQFAASAVSEDRSDVTVRWGGMGYGFKAAAAAAIANPQLDDADLQYNGSASILHQDTGLNFTLSYGTRDRNDGQANPTNYFTKLGWITRIFSVGDTAFSVDYTRSLNLPTDDDDGYSYAAAAVQEFDRFGVEAFAMYRIHSLDLGSGPDLEDITIVSIGSRVNF